MATDEYTGSERRKDSAMSVIDHAKICSVLTGNIDNRLNDIHKRLDDGEAHMSKIDVNLSSNTVVTEEIKSILDAAKGAFKFFDFVGRTLKWALGIGASVLVFWVALKDFKGH